MHLHLFFGSWHQGVLLLMVCVTQSVLINKIACIADVIQPLVSNVCKATPKSLFWTPNELNTQRNCLFQCHISSNYSIKGFTVSHTSKHVPHFSAKNPDILIWVLIPVMVKTFACRSLPVQASGNSLNNHLFEKANQNTYSDLGTRLGVQNKDFGAVSQTDLTRG